jgi:hypothetical protein
MVLKANPAIVSRSFDEVFAAIRRLAVIPVAISVMRAELLQLCQAPDEQFRAFAARVQGKAETCSFATNFTCTCSKTAVDYTTDMTRDVLLAGIADADIRRETLGTADVHRLDINAIITLVEPKEMARDALPSSTQAAFSSLRRRRQDQDVPPQATNDSPQKTPCPECGQLFSPFTKLRSGRNTVPHKMCKACYLQQVRSKRHDGKNRPTPPSRANAVEVADEDGFIIASTSVSSPKRRRHRRPHTQTLDHNIFSAGEWRRAKLTDHPRVHVNVSIVDSSSNQASRSTFCTSVYAITDSGAQSNIWSLKDFDAAGFPRSALFPVSLSLRAANSSGIRIHGAFVAKIAGTASDGKTISCQTTIYVSEQVKDMFLSFDTMVDLLVVGRNFPSIGSAEKSATSPSRSSRPPARRDTPPDCPKLSVASQRAMNAGCSANTTGHNQCDCPQREVVPPLPDHLPFKCVPENNVLMKKWLLDRYGASTFNTCPHRPLPCMSGPPVEIHIEENATPRTCHVAAAVPLHWQKKVYEDLLRDEALGVIERVPYGQPVDWCHRMVVTRKHDGTPRRTVDLSPLNKFCKRETFASDSPFHMARRIPGNTWKTVTDAWNGYHSVPLRESDRHLTTFITPFGRWRYTRAPQGFLSSGDGYNRRFDAIISDFERKERCVDDTIHYDVDLEQHWRRTMKFLSTVGNAGIVLNPTKFQFAERTVDFAGFCVSESSITPLPKYIDAIRHFPRPKSTTDIRSWFGLVNQVANYAQLRDVMAPFRPYLSPKQQFEWTSELNAAFEASKTNIIKSIQRGVEIFDVHKRTCLRPDFSNRGLGFFLLQQHCSCTSGLPGCCLDGWKITLAGSRFLSSAEQRYAPVEGEALAVAWGLEQTRFFTQGCADLLVVTDHKPLVKILGDRTLDEIQNTRLFRLKQRTLPWHFAISHLPGKSNLAADAASRHPSPASQPIALSDECDDADFTELATIFGDLHVDDGTEQATLAAIRQEAQEVTTLSWEAIAAATESDASMKSLVDTIVAGFPLEHKDLQHASPYWRYRESLYVSHGVVMFEDRVVIPLALRRQVLDNLHAAHQGQSSMELRARAIVFWPGMTLDISNTRARCDDCNRNAPSQASLPSTPAQPPTVPFEAVVADYFDFAGRHYLVIADRLSGWVEIFATPTGSKQAGAQGLVDRLRNFMAIFGVPEELSSDGGPEFAASATRDFLERWGVQHRMSSAYHPQSNGRAEVAVKSAKRLLKSNTDSAGLLDSDRFLRAILQLRNTPDPDCGKSPAEIVFGRPLHDTLSFSKRLHKFGGTVHHAPEVHPSWREAWSAKESALRHRFVRQSDALNAHARNLPRLLVGDQVFIQNQTGNAPKRWDKTGIVVEQGNHDQYIIKVIGSGRLTTRNRQFLRQFHPATGTHQAQKFRATTWDHELAPSLSPAAGQDQLAIPIAQPTPPTSLSNDSHAPYRQDRVDLPPEPIQSVPSALPVAVSTQLPPRPPNDGVQPPATTPQRRIQPHRACKDNVTWT